MESQLERAADSQRQQIQQADMALERLKKQVELSSEKAYAETKLQVSHTLAHMRYNVMFCTCRQEAGHVSARSLSHACTACSSFTFSTFIFFLFSLVCFQTHTCTFILFVVCSLSHICRGKLSVPQMQHQPDEPTTLQILSLALAFSLQQQSINEKRKHERINQPKAKFNQFTPHTNELILISK